MGRPKTVDDDELVDVLQSGEGAPVMTAREVAEALPLTPRAVLSRLESLHDEGRVGRKDVGARASVWWAPKDGKWVRVGRGGISPSAEEHASLLEPDWYAVRTVLENADLPGRGQKVEARIDAVTACFVFLVDHGEARPAHFKQAVYPDHPAEYTAGEDPAQSWWNNAIYPGLRALADAGLGIQRPNQSGQWRYTPRDATTRDEAGRPTI